MYKKKIKRAPESTILKVTVTKLAKPSETSEKSTSKNIKYSLLWKRAIDVLHHLKTLYPVISQQHPLCIGISKQLHEKHREIPTRLINTALYIHTHARTYLKNILTDKGRYALDNHIVEPIDSFVKEQTKITLAKMHGNSKHVKPKPNRSYSHSKQRNFSTRSRNNIVVSHSQRH